MTDIRQTNSHASWITKPIKNHALLVMHFPASTNPIPTGEGFTAAISSDLDQVFYVSFVLSLDQRPTSNVTNKHTWTSRKSMYPCPDIWARTTTDDIPIPALSRLKRPLAIYAHVRSSR